MTERMHWSSMTSVVITFLFFFLMQPSFGACANSYEVSGMVKNIVTKTPATNVRIIFAPQVDNGESCVFAPTLSASTNEAGKFSINDVEPGRYCIFFGSVGDSLDLLKGAKIPTSTNKIMIAHEFKTDNKLTEPVKALKGGQMMVKDGQLVIHGYLYVQSLNLLVFSNEGRLQYVDIEANTTDLIYDLKPGTIK